MLILGPLKYQSIAYNVEQVFIRKIWCRQQNLYDLFLGTKMFVRILKMLLPYLKQLKTQNCIE